MIGAILGAVGGLASGIFGGIKSAKAAREQQRLINEQESKNNAWYNRNYYQNYMESAEAQAAMKRVENTLKKQNQEARATAAVMGSTPEAVVAQQQANNEILDNTATGMAARADAALSLTFCKALASLAFCACLVRSAAVCLSIRPALIDALSSASIRSLSAFRRIVSCWSLASLSAFALASE